MPFPPGTPGALKAVYGQIEAAVRRRASTGEIWQAIRSGLGVESTVGMGITAADVSRLRGIAAQVRNAEETLASAIPGRSLSVEDIGVPVWARSAGQRAAAPRYHLRVRYTAPNPLFLEGVVGAEPTIGQWMTLEIPGLPATVADVRDLAESYLEELLYTAPTEGGYPIPDGATVGQIQLLAV